jgi:AraC family transcriptional regulator
VARLRADATRRGGGGGLAGGGMIAPAGIEDRAGALLEVRDVCVPAPLDTMVRTDRNHLILFLSPPALPGELRCPDSGDAAFRPAMPMRFRPAGVPYQLRGMAGRSRLFRYAFDDDRLSAALDMPVRWTTAEIARGLDLSASRLAPLVMRIADEILHPAIGSAALIDAMGTMVLVELVRHLRGDAAVAVREDGLSPRLLSRLRERVEDGSVPPPAVRELAQLCGISERTLLRLFRAATGETVSAYLQRIQTGRARQLLTGDLPLKEIAFRLGFAQPSGFIAAFRRTAGETPDRFRRRLRRAAEGDLLH